MKLPTLSGDPYGNKTIENIIKKGVLQHSLNLFNAL